MKAELNVDIFGLSRSDFKLNMEELVLAGHSFGGITAITTAASLKEQPKAVFVMDPWFFANHELFQTGKLKLQCPV